MLWARCGSFACFWCFDINSGLAGRQNFEEAIYRKNKSCPYVFEPYHEIEHAYRIKNMYDGADTYVG